MSNDITKPERVLAAFSGVNGPLSLSLLEVMNDGNSGVAPGLRAVVAVAEANGTHVSDIVDILADFVRTAGPVAAHETVEALTLADQAEFFTDPKRVEAIGNAVSGYTLENFLRNYNLNIRDVTRQQILSYWADFIEYADEEHAVSLGQADPTGESVFWPATKALAVKMKQHPQRYQGLANFQLNDPDRVNAFLFRTNNAESFLEVLTGLTIKELRESGVIKCFQSSDHQGSAISSIRFALAKDSRSPEVERHM